jgi:transcriptional regulator with GAF, ATPase, and Fis domain
MMTTSGPGLAPSHEQRLVATFVELADTLIADFDVVEFFAVLAERVVELGMATQAGILLVDETGSLRFMAASDERTQLLELFQVQSREGPCQDCFRTGAHVAVSQLEDERDRWPQFVPQALATGFVSVHAFPLRLRDTVLGAMNLFHDGPVSIDPADLAVVQAMADVATIGLMQQRELHRAHSVEAQLQHALNSRVTIEQSKGIIFEQASVSMSDAFEMIRSYTRDHNAKLSDTAHRIVDGTLTARDLPAPR